MLGIYKGTTLSNDSLYTDSERIEMFMDSFHAHSQQSFWPTIRDSMAVYRHSAFSLSQEEGEDEATFNEPGPDHMHVAVIAAVTRKYFAEQDEVLFPAVLASAERLGLDSGLQHVIEAQSIWRQATASRLRFAIHDGGLTGLLADDGDMLDWGQVDRDIDGQIVTTTVSLKEFGDEFLYNGFLHAREPKHKRDKRRQFLRSIPQSIRFRLAVGCFSAVAYATTILHHQINRHLAGFECPKECHEMEIMRKNEDALENSEG